MPVNELFLYGDIGDTSFWGDTDGITDVGVLEALNQLDTQASGLNVHINSYGGDVSVGLTIMNLIRSYSVKMKALVPTFEVQTIVDGFAYSAGTILMLAADKRIMNPGTKCMIHNPLTMVMGDYREMESAAKRLKVSRDQSIALYAQATGKEADSIGQMMNDETYMSPEQAKAFGLATDIVKLDGTPVETLSLPPGSSPLLKPQKPYENNMELLLEVAKRGHGAYQKSLLQVKKKSSSESSRSLSFLKKEVELFSML